MTVNPVPVETGAGAAVSATGFAGGVPRVADVVFIVTVVAAVVPSIAVTV